MKLELVLLFVALAGSQAAIFNRLNVQDVESKDASLMSTATWSPWRTSTWSWWTTQTYSWTTVTENPWWTSTWAWMTTPRQTTNWYDWSTTPWLWYTSTQRPETTTWNAWATTSWYPWGTTQQTQTNPWYWSTTTWSWWSTAASTSTYAPSVCPDGAIASVDESTCYVVVRDTKTFIEAETYCKMLNGHLASFHNAFDNMLVNDYARQYLGVAENFFIGANDLTSRGNWQWIDGTSFDFQDFTTSEDVLNMDCAQVETGHGYWNKVDCYERSNFACTVPTNWSKK